MFWLFLSCLAVVNLFSHSAAAVFSAKTNLGSHRCAAPRVRDSWALEPSIKLPAHERETWIVAPWDDKRSWSPEQTLPGRARQYWHALVWTLKENTQIQPSEGKPQGCMTRPVGLCLTASQPVQGCHCPAHRDGAAAAHQADERRDSLGSAVGSCLPEGWHVLLVTPMESHHAPRPSLDSTGPHLRICHFICLLKGICTSFSCCPWLDFQDGR